jgi:hypothetical protein
VDDARGCYSWRVEKGDAATRCTTLSALLKSRSVAAVRRSGNQIADFRTLIRVVRKECVAAREGTPPTQLWLEDADMRSLLKTLNPKVATPFAAS